MGQQKFWYKSGSCQSVGKRHNQEDAIIFSSLECADEKGILAVLCDGMGGMEDGERFSKIGTEEMVKCFENLPAQSDLCQTLVSCFQTADQAAKIEQQVSSGGYGRLGSSTVVSVLLKDHKCAYLSAGDSRIYLWRNGGIIQLTRDQILGNLLDERAALGIISHEDARRNIRRETLVNGLGIEGAVPFDLSSEPFTLLERDKIVLMSDGVFNTLNEQEICNALCFSAQDAAEKLIDMTIKKNKPRQDNCSVIILEVLA